MRRRWTAKASKSLKFWGYRTHQSLLGSFLRPPDSGGQPHSPRFLLAVHRAAIDIQHSEFKMHTLTGNPGKVDCRPQAHSASAPPSFQQHNFLRLGKALRAHSAKVYPTGSVPRRPDYIVMTAVFKTIDEPGHLFAKRIVHNDRYT